MTDLQPRYEYRVWADSLEDVRNDLQRLATVLGMEASEETYLLSATTDRCNAKIRGGRINIKAMIATEQGLELWKPVLEAEFPLDKSVIAGQIFPGLELRPPDLHRPLYSIDEFLKQVVEPQPQVAIVTTVKRRTRFRLDDCLAEITSVTVGRVTCHTAAVESISPDPVLRFVHQLKIDRIPNTSYIRWLKQIPVDRTDVVCQRNC